MSVTPRRKPLPAIEYEPGTRFGLVAVLEPGASFGTGRVYRVVCDCGVVREVLGSSLRRWPPTTHRACHRQVRTA